MDCEPTDFREKKVGCVCCLKRSGHTCRSNIKEYPRMDGTESASADSWLELPAADCLRCFIINAHSDGADNENVVCSAILTHSESKHEVHLANVGSFLQPVEERIGAAQESGGL
jgi:hypothetical protein